MHAQFATPLSKVRALIIAALVAGTLSMAPVGARPAVASFACSPSNCAYLEVAWVGKGTVRVTDDLGLIDCRTASGFVSGTCGAVYRWSPLSGPLSVRLTFDPDTASFVCILDSCVNPGVNKVKIVSLSNGDNDQVLTGANVAFENYVNVTVSGDGSGRVTSSPEGIDCRYAGVVRTGTCEKTFLSMWGIDVSYLIDPDDGSYLCYFGCRPVNGTFTVVGSDWETNKTIDVQFKKAHPWLTVATSGSGTVVSSPSGLDCPGTCSKYFPPNTGVTLSAAAKVGYVFSSWTGACAAYGAICNVSLGSTDVATTAVFVSASTPAPTAPPTSGPAPTSTPRPGTTPAPSAPPSRSPIATAAGPTTAPGPTRVPGSTPAPGSSAGPDPSAGPDASAPAADPDGSPVALASPVPTGESATLVPGAGEAGATPAQSVGAGAVTPASGGAPGALDPLAIVLFVIGAAMLVLLGLLVGVRAGRAHRPPVA